MTLPKASKYTSIWLQKLYCTKKNYRFHAGTNLSTGTKQFSQRLAVAFRHKEAVFSFSSDAMVRHHIPKSVNVIFPSQVLVSSHIRPCRNLTFYNILGRQGSSYCNRALLNLQAFSLHDMKIGTRSREGCHVGPKMSYQFSFC